MIPLITQNGPSTSQNAHPPNRSNAGHLALPGGRGVQGELFERIDANKEPFEFRGEFGF